MTENSLKIRIYRMLRSSLHSCKSKDQISDVVSTHHRRRHLFSPQQPHPFSYSPAAEEATAKLPLLSPDVSGRKFPPASPAISPLNNFYDFPKHKKKAKNKKKKARSIAYKKRAYEERFPDCKYVYGLLSSDDDGGEEKEESRRKAAAAVEDSMAVVKRSSDPYNDFMTSMVEMIVEKHIFAANDLENLLRCFLSLNSYHHHKVIIQVFVEIWEAFFSCNEI